jgi:hypothetical protein
MILTICDNSSARRRNTLGMDPPQNQLQGRRIGGPFLFARFVQAIAFAAYGSPGAGLMSAL